MKKLYFTSYLLLLILCSFIISSCIDIERKITINKDGSGKEKMIMVIDKSFFDMMISFASMLDKSKQQEYIDSLYDDELFIKQFQKTFNDAEGVRLISVDSKTNPDSSKTVIAEYTFENVKYIGNSLKYSYVSSKKSDEDIADISFKDDGDKVVFKYYVISKETKNNSYQDLASSYFENKKLILDIDFPFDIISSNASYTNGRNLKWEFKMDDLISKTSEMKLDAVMKK